MKHPGELRRGVDEVGEIGLAVVRQRSGDADDHRLAGRQLPVRVRGSEALDDRAQPIRGHVLDIGLAASQTLEPPRVGVDADHVAARLGKGRRKRQAHVSEPDDPYLHGRAG